jgi:2-polyprenyl-6-methoxyphenol hydroxylase-like FAD-dependent oxidoreductase
MRIEHGSSVRRVIVAGAGIGGPVLAMWLRRLGMEVVLVEARDAAALAEGAFLGVAPNGMNVLGELGLAEAVAAHGHACTGFRFRNRRGRSIGFIDRSLDRDQFRWPLTMIRRGELHGLLTDEAARIGVDVRYGMRLAAVAQLGVRDSDGAVVRAPDKTPSGGDRGRPVGVVARFDDGSAMVADLLVGADGLRSTVRSLVVPDAPAPTFTGLLDYGGFAPRAAVPFPPGVNEMVFGRRAFFGAFATPSGETWWFHNGPSAEPDEAGAPRSHEEKRARLLDLHRDDPPWIADLIRSTPEILGAWPIHDLEAMPRWCDGRVALLGDAAHAMSPSAGQGASLAMEDAMELAQCLRDIDDPVAALATFERRRRPRVDAIFQQARRASSSKAPAGCIAAWLRDRLLPLFLRLGAAAQERAYGYRIAWDQPVAPVA